MPELPQAHWALLQPRGPPQQQQHLSRPPARPLPGWPRPHPSSHPPWHSPKGSFMVFLQPWLVMSPLPSSLPAACTVAVPSGALIPSQHWFVGPALASQPPLPPSGLTIARLPFSPRAVGGRRFEPFLLERQSGPCGSEPCPAHCSAWSQCLWVPLRSALWSEYSSRPRSDADDDCPRLRTGGGASVMDTTPSPEICPPPPIQSRFFLHGVGGVALSGKTACHATSAALIPRPSSRGHLALVHGTAVDTHTTYASAPGSSPVSSIATFHFPYIACPSPLPCGSFRGGATSTWPAQSAARPDGPCNPVIIARNSTRGVARGVWSRCCRAVW